MATPFPQTGIGRWFISGDVPASLEVVGSYEPSLVVLSVLVAIVASWAALQLADLARTATIRASRLVALGAGSLALGAGVWAMHFIGMLAFQLCAPVHYSPVVTLASMLPSLAASAVALHLIARRDITRWQLAVGGLLVGAGIGAMHYGGMLAMKMTPLLAFRPTWFAASIVVAVALSILSLWVRHGLVQRAHLSVARANALAGVVMGFAISGMHYTGMASARFIGETDPAFDPSAGQQAMLALAVAFVALAIGAIAFGAQALLRVYYLSQNLQEGERRLRAVVDTAVDGIISIDATGRILSFNASAERMFGWAAHEVIGTNVNRLMPAENSAGHDGYIENYLRSGVGKIIGSGRELVGQHRDGHAIPLRLAISRTEVKGAPVFFGIVTDISERKAFERELRNREKQYRTLIANMPGVAFRSEAGIQTRLIFVSDRLEGLTGWPADDFVTQGRDFDALVHPEDCRRAQQLMREALEADRPYAVEYRLTRRDGQVRWISETAGGVRDADGRLQWIDGVMLDVTEERLRSREFESVVDVLNGAMAVMELGRDGRILRCNAKYVSMLGYDRAEELIGRSYSDMIPQRARRSEAQHDPLEVLMRGEVLAGEFERVGKDGREIWVQATYNPVFDEAGELVKMMAFKTDITARKHMERELIEAKARAEQAAAARSSFLANMSHEIRTPMNAIIGFTDVVLNTGLSPQQRRHMETVRQSAQSLLSLLNDILDTAKLEKGAVELEVRDFSLRALCEQVAVSMRLTAEQKALRLELDYPQGAPEHYRGDALRIQQVLVNLVGNAIKFTHEGRVDIVVRRERDTTVIAVTDTGIGIAPDRVERIFDAFSQADASITRKFGGTGLGTTIARQLVELMGGRIVVTSELGVGSRFEVRLPLLVGEAPVAASEGHRLRLPPLRILVADDVAQNIELLELVLQDEGHTVQPARNGVEAVELSRSGQFDVVLMDMHMPVLDGLSATQAIRAREREDGRKPTPVIALTASVQASDRLAAQQAGMDGFATKPVVVEQLVAEIARVLGIEAGEQGAWAASAAAAAVDTGVIDWAAGLVTWKTPQRLRRAVANFLQGQEGVAQHLHEALAHGDHGALAAAAHRIAGASANLALIDLRTAAQRLEQAARAHDLAGARQAGDDLLTHLHAANEEFASEPPPDSAPAPIVGVETDRLLTQLDRLEQALRGSGLDEDALAQLSEYFPPSHLRKLLEAIDNFEFQQALDCVRALRGTLHEAARNPVAIDGA